MPRELILPFLINFAIFLGVGAAIAASVYLLLDYLDARRIRAKFRTTMARFRAGEWLESVGFRKTRRLTYKPPVSDEQAAEEG